MCILYIQDWMLKGSSCFLIQWHLEAFPFHHSINTCMLLSWDYKCMNPFTIIDLNLVCTMKEFIHTHCYWEEVLFGYMWSQKKSFLVICDPMVMIDYTLYQNVWWIISWIMYHSIHSLHVTSLNQWDGSIDVVEVILKLTAQLWLTYKWM